MARIMEIFVIVNAACGIAAFLIAKGLINRANRKARELFGGDNDERPEHERNRRELTR